MAKVTIQSMARELGLSRNTVSMALKKNPLVTKNTQELVFRHAVEVGYLPSPVGERETAKGQEERHIMILRQTDEAAYWDRVINGITEEARRNHCQTHIAVILPEEEESGFFPSGLDIGIDAVFFMKMPNREYVRKVKEHGHLVFMLDDFCKEEPQPLGDVVCTNGLDAVKFLTEHLIGQGMRRIGYLSENSSRFETMHDRYMGYREAMIGAGLPFPEGLVMPDMESDHFYFERSFDKVVEDFQGFGELPEAVVCGNDMIAMLLTKAFRRKGILVPEDVAVTGFDNDEVGRIDPFFSTVDVDGKWLGQRLVQSFIQRIRYPDAPYEKILLYGKPIIRSSSVKSGKK